MKKLIVFIVLLISICNTVFGYNFEKDPNTSGDQVGGTWGWVTDDDNNRITGKVKLSDWNKAKNDDDKIKTFLNDNKPNTNTNTTGVPTDKQTEGGTWKTSGDNWYTNLASSEELSDEEDIGENQDEYFERQGTWVQDNGKWKFITSDGYAPTGEILLVGGKYYAFDYDGYWINSGEDKQSAEKAFREYENKADEDDGSISSDDYSIDDAVQGRWIGGGDRWKFKSGDEFITSEVILAPDGAGGVRYYAFDENGICLNPNGSKSEAEAEAILDGSGNSESGTTSSETISCKSVILQIEFPAGNWVQGSKGWWFGTESSYAKNCIGFCNQYQKWFAFNGDGWVVGNVSGYDDQLEAAKEIGGTSTNKSSSVKNKSGNSKLKITDLNMPELRMQSNGVLKMELDDVKDSQNGKVSRGASNFNTLGTQYSNTKLIFDQETKIYTMESKNQKSSEICVKATKVTDTVLDLQVGGTIFRSFPYKQNNDKTIKLHKTLFDMLESCYIDIDEDGKADVKTKYSYASLKVDDNFLQYIYFLALSDDMETANYYTVPIFLFKINGQFIEVNAANVNSGNQFSITIPGAQQVTIIKEGFLGKIQPMEIFDGCQIINPPVSNVNEISVKDIKAEHRILEINVGKVNVITKDNLNNVDIVSAYSIGNNVYLTNNINAVSLINNSTNLTNSLEDNKQLYSDVNNLINDTLSTIRSLFQFVIKVIMSYICIVIAIVVTLRWTSLGIILMRKKIDLLSIITFGRLSHMQFNLLSFIVYIVLLFVIYTIANIIYYMIF